MFPVPHPYYLFKTLCIAQPSHAFRKISGVVIPYVSFHSHVWVETQCCITNFCRLLTQGLISHIYIPVLVYMLINITIFFWYAYTIYTIKKKKNHADSFFFISASTIVKIYFFYHWKGLSFILYYTNRLYVFYRWAGLLLKNVSMKKFTLYIHIHKSNMRMSANSQTYHHQLFSM